MLLTEFPKTEPVFRLWVSYGYWSALPRDYREIAWDFVRMLEERAGKARKPAGTRDKRPCQARCWSNLLNKSDILVHTVGHRVGDTTSQSVGSKFESLAADHKIDTKSAQMPEQPTFLFGFDVVIDVPTSL